MTGLEERPETARGRAVYELLLAVHAGIRRDLERVAGLAAKAADGLPPEELQQELHELRRDSFLWRLRVDCLRYCGFVHAHHNAEDHAFFPELRATNPEIGPVVDRLEATTGASPTYSTRSKRRPMLSRSAARPTRDASSWMSCTSWVRACWSTWHMRSSTSSRPCCGSEKGP